MNLLVTAGNTLALVDRVRCLTNIFTGRTGAAIALEAQARGHTVTLLTSHAEAVAELRRDSESPTERWGLRRYRTFEELHDRMQELIGKGGLDAVVHCAAVSDYLSGGVYAPAEGTSFRPDPGTWHAPAKSPPTLIDRSAGKVKSDEPELWLRLVRAPKLVDLIRADWGFHGLLVKFKLEVGVSDKDLVEIAERSRLHSRADLMVANTLEDSAFHAFIGPLGGTPARRASEGFRLHTSPTRQRRDHTSPKRQRGIYRKVGRRELAEKLLQILEQMQEGGRG